NWTQFNHELNRITGGTGIAIAFNYEIPQVSDEEKVEADKKAVEASIISRMVAEGYSLDSVIDAFQLSNAYKLLKRGNNPPVIENDKPDVDEGNEVIDSPDPDKANGIVVKNKVIIAKSELSDEKKLENVAINLMES